ncbi:ov-16 antigen [Lichtheimia corymbifera JMRC:FSU:9682]|uniref:Ov-16 antigen n=1 Tax=Lichtheimia corymbifera JMRC:FSU:9682 TaxID=1263082 RepID=A0A068S0H7_9FUNG|nr:ov-16 antigen [Lichtheimia corymbifera JMRC:FSU:9682]
MPLLTTDMNLKGALQKANLIPEVISESFSPSTLLQVTYPNDREVTLGNTLTTDETSQTPEIFFVPPEPEASYTLIMTDPDAPSTTDHQYGPWRHWIAVNISGSNVADIKEHHTPYIGPGPGPNTGLHRYLFLLYKQPSPNQSFQAMAHENKPDRRCFDLTKFVSEHQLELVAANFFLCANSSN